MTMENQNQKLNLPLGYKFKPRPSELLRHYLLNKIMGRNLPADVIPTFDCFSCSPHRLPFDQFTHGIANEWYFFTERREDKIVTTEDGYYDVYEERNEYDETDKIIGFVRIFDYYHGKPPSGIVSEWSIVEFRVHPDQLVNKEKTPSIMDSNLVVCKVIRYVPEIMTTGTSENTTIVDNDDS